MTYSRLTQRLVLFSLLIVTVFARPVEAADNLRSAMSKAAKAVHVHLKNENESQIVVGHFEGPAGVTGGPGIAHILGEELKKIGARIQLEPAGS